MKTRIAVALVRFWHWKLTRNPPLLTVAYKLDRQAAVRELDV